MSWHRRIAGLSGRTAVVLVVLVLAVAAGDRSGLVADLSADRRFSVHPALRARLAALPAERELIAIWRADAMPPGDLVAGIERIAAASPRLRLKRIDPDADKPLLEQFTKRYGNLAVPGLFVASGDAASAGARALRIPLQASVLQREIAGALSALDEAKPPLAVVLQGHGELGPGGGEDDGDLLLRGLEQAGFRVVLADASRPAAIPAEALLVVPGPQRSLGDRDLADLNRHLRDGGGVLIFADDRAPADLAVMLRLRGVFLPHGVPRRLATIDLKTPGAASAAIGSLFNPSAATMPAEILLSRDHYRRGRDRGFASHNLVLSGPCLPPHPAAESVRRLTLLSPLSTSVGVFVPPPDLLREMPDLAQRFAAVGTTPFAMRPLLRTWPEDAWLQPREAAQRDAVELSEHGLAATVDYAPAPDSARAGIGGRLAVWGSRAAASNAVLAQGEFANAELIAGIARYLVRREPPPEIPPADTARYQVRASDTAVTILLGVFFAVLPCLCLGAAMLAYLDRRR